MSCPLWYTAESLKKVKMWTHIQSLTGIAIRMVCIAGAGIAGHLSSWDHIHNKQHWVKCNGIKSNEGVHPFSYTTHSRWQSVEGASTTLQWCYHWSQSDIVAWTPHVFPLYYCNCLKGPFCNPNMLFLWHSSVDMHKKVYL